MNHLFKKASLLVIFALLFSSCTHETKQEAASENPDSVKTTAQALSNPNPDRFKEVSLNEQTVLQDDNLTKSKQLSAAEVKALSISLLDSTGAGSESAFTYHMLDTLFTSSKFQVFLIGRAYIEENEIWAASYDRKGALIDQKLVFYDNSEGAFSMSSDIKGKSITIQTLNEYAEEEAEKQLTEVFTINEQGKFSKQP